jgi:hypothetical protein
VEVTTKTIVAVVILVVGIVLEQIVMVGLYLVQDLEHFFIVADFAIKIAHL